MMGMQRIRRRKQQKERREGENKRSFQSLEVPARQLGKAPGPKQVNIMVGVDPEMQNQDQLSQVLDASLCTVVPTISARGFISKNVEQVLGINSIMQTRGIVLELSGKITKGLMKILLDSGSTSNFLSTQAGG